MGTVEAFVWLLGVAVLALGMAVLLLWKKLRAASMTKDRHLDPETKSRYDHYASILDNTDDVAWLFDIETLRLVYVTPSVERLRGWATQELIGRTAHELVPPGVANRIGELITSLKQQQAANPAMQYSDRIELEVPTKGGGTMPVETEYKILGDTQGKPVLILGVSRDISARKRKEGMLQDSEERVRLALLCSGDGVWDIDLQTREMVFLEGWEKILGYRPEELEQTLDGYTGLIHPDDRNRMEAEIDRHVSGESATYQCEFRIRTKDGGWRWVLSRGKLWSRTADGKALRMIGTHTDITSRKVSEVAMSRANVKLHTQIDEIRLLQTQLAEQAVRDPLTGLYNRRYLDETLDREVARARREGSPLSVVMLDVDHFKKLNDSYGHQAGDEILKSLAELLRQDTRAEDVACRYGGEEFLVLLPSMPLDKARDRAEHWRQELEKHKFAFGNFSLSVTASFGVSSYPHHGKTPDDLTRSADYALYSAKRSGRNRVEVFEDAPIVFVTGSQGG